MMAKSDEDEREREREDVDVDVYNVSKEIEYIQCLK